MDSTIYDAVSDTIRAIGGFKQTSARLWPALNLNSAYARLKHCVDDSHREKLNLDELALLAEWGAAVGHRDIAQYLCTRSGGVFTSVPAADDRTELRRRFTTVSAELAVISKALLP